MSLKIMNRGVANALEELNVQLKKILGLEAYRATYAEDVYYIGKKGIFNRMFSEEIGKIHTWNKNEISIKIDKEYKEPMIDLLKDMEKKYKDVGFVLEIMNPG